MDAHVPDSLPPRNRIVPQRVRVAACSEIPSGSAKVVVACGRVVALFHLDGAFFAVDNTCPHRGGPLAEGVLEGRVVTCPWHGWKYDVRTGEMTMNPAARVNCYQARVESGDVQVSC